MGHTYNPEFQVVVDQQAVAPALGTITVSNIHYRVVSGATLGPITVECSGGAQVSGTIVGFPQFVGRPVNPKAPASGDPGWTCVETTGTLLQPYRTYSTINIGQANEERVSWSNFQPGSSIAPARRSGTRCSTCPRHPPMLWVRP